MEKKIFRSRISVLLVIILFTVLLLPIIPIINSGNISDPAAFYTVVGVIVFIVLLLGGTRYIISNKWLYIKLWFIPFGQEDISVITSVKRSYNPLSSPAGSLKRLRVNFLCNSFWLISPVREQEFLDTLKEINPKIQINVSNKNDWWRIWDWDI